MKNMLRTLLICLARILCLASALVACDKPVDETPTDTSTEAPDGTPTEAPTEDGKSEVEIATNGVEVVRHTIMDNTVKVFMYQIEEANGQETVKCSLVAYSAADNTVLDYVIFDLKVNGQRVQFGCFNGLNWSGSKINVSIRDLDGVETIYTLDVNK